jgi:hypothetical protein
MNESEFGNAPEEISSHFAVSLSIRHSPSAVVPKRLESLSRAISMTFEQPSKDPTVVTCFVSGSSR